jgi:hypothetical protein
VPVAEAGENRGRPMIPKVTSTVTLQLKTGSGGTSLDELSEFPTIEVERQTPATRSAVAAIAAESDNPGFPREELRWEGTALMPACTAHYPAPTADATDARDRACYLIRTIFPTNGPLPAR